MIERTKEYRRIKVLAPDWDLVVSDKVYYLAEMNGHEDIGVICFHPCEETGLLMHVEMGWKCRGSRAGEAYNNAFKWMFENTDHETLLGRIPKDYVGARVMAHNIGGHFDGIDVDGLRCYSVSKHDFEKRIA